MDTATQHILETLTEDFYASLAESFSSTRQSPWSGWSHITRFIEPDNVLDLACGNLRFERFLMQQLASKPCHFYAFDNCTQLAKDIPENVQFRRLNLLDEPIPADTPLCDLSVCFGFFHHVPGQDRRLNILNSLLDHTRSKGIVIISFWQFMNNERTAAKALQTTELARQQFPLDNLDEGDYLLGWQNTDGVYRYCHNFTEQEIDQLADATSGRAHEIERFSADGKSGVMNRYLVLERL